MKTSDSVCNPSVTLVMTVAEAMTIWSALVHYEKTHRKFPKDPKIKDDGKWGHFDCPPRIQPLLSLIKLSIKDEAPDLFETCFGYLPSECTSETGQQFTPLPFGTPNTSL